MKKVLLILITLLPLVVKAQTSEDSLLKSWIYKDREFRDRSMYCLKYEYSKPLVIKYISKDNFVRKARVNQITKVYIIKPELEDKALPDEVGIVEYWTEDNKKIHMDRITYVYN